jgi:superfamily I DNA/RNA helicase
MTQYLQPPLDSKQQLAYERLTKYGRIMIEAAPGTGKTFTGVHLAVQAARHRLTSRERPALFLTFSKNARVQIENEIDHFRKEKWVSHSEISAVKVSNYHAFFLEVLRLRGGIFGIRNVVKPCVIASREKKIKKFLRKMKIDKADFESKHCSSLCWIDSEINLPANVITELQRITMNDLKNHQPHYNEFAPLVFKILKMSNPFCEWLRIKYPLLILDEFQDSDCCQWEILKLWEPPRVAIFYDRYQMIYEWRKAKGTRINEVATFWSINNDAQLVFDEIHRTGDQKTLSQFIKELRQDDLKGYDIHDENRKWLTLVTPSEDKIRETAKPEEIVRETIRWNPRIRENMRDNESTAIICKTNYLVSFLQEYLRKKPLNSNIYYPCRWIESGESIDERLRNHLYDLSLITNKYELRGWLGNLLDEILPVKHKINFSVDFRVLPQNRDGSGPKSKLKKLLEPIWDEISSENTNAFLKAFMLIPIITRILSENRGHPDYEALGYIKRMVKAAEVFPKNISFTDAIAKFENCILQSSYLFLKHKQEGIIILNCHQAKGREFDHVIIPWLSNRGEPSFKGSANNERRYYKYDYDKDEDRRLLYVAFTRAKKRITIVYPGNDPSHFLSKWKLV